MTGKVGGSRRTWSVPLRRVEGDGAPLALFWARERIRELEVDAWSGRGLRRSHGKTGSLHQEIAALSKGYGVMSRETSYVAVETRSEEGRTLEDAVVRKVPVMLTKGWQGISVGQPSGPYFLRSPYLQFSAGIVHARNESFEALSAEFDEAVSFQAEMAGRSLPLLDDGMLNELGKTMDALERTVHQWRNRAGRDYSRFQKDQEFSLGEFLNMLNRTLSIDVAQPGLSSQSIRSYGETIERQFSELEENYQETLHRLEAITTRWSQVSHEMEALGSGLGELMETLHRGLMVIVEARKDASARLQERLQRAYAHDGMSGAGRGDPLLHLLSLQRFEGGFGMDEAAARMVGLTVRSLREKASAMELRSSADRFTLLATAIILTLLKGRYASRKGEWGPLVGKSEGWLNRCLEEGEPRIDGQRLMEWVASLPVPSS